MLFRYPAYRSVPLALALIACQGQIADQGPAGPLVPANRTGEAMPPEQSARTRMDSPPSNQPASMPGTVTSSQWRCTPPPRRFWRLTPDQQNATLAAAFPVPPPDSADVRSTFSSGSATATDADLLVMSLPHVNALFTEADAAAQLAATHRTEILPCLGATTGQAACVQMFLDRLGTHLFRRPLAADERDRYQGLYDKITASDGADVALQSVVQALLMSPAYLFRSEMGDGTTATGGALSLTAYEQASALSYFLTDGPPDDDLLAAAAAGDLRRTEQVALQTRRLLATPQKARGLLRFLNQQMKLGSISDLRKDAKVFPTFDSKVAADLNTEAQMFLEEALVTDGVRLPTLLTATWGFVDARIAPLYGVAAPGDAAFHKVELPAGQRAGMLTRAGILATFANDHETEPVRRGRFVREQLLCQALPPPPPNVPPPPDSKGMLTQRDRLAIHSAATACAGCHALMDPIGLAFEEFDGIGQYRTTEFGKALDTSGKLTGTAASDGPFTGAVDLAARLAAAPEVAGCFARRLAEHAQGRALPDGDQCTFGDLPAQVARTGGSLVDLAVALTTADSFFLRAP